MMKTNNIMDTITVVEPARSELSRYFLALSVLNMAILSAGVSVIDLMRHKRTIVTVLEIVVSS